MQAQEKCNTQLLLNTQQLVASFQNPLEGIFIALIGSVHFGFVQDRFGVNWHLDWCAVGGVHSYNFQLIRANKI